MMTRRRIGEVDFCYNISHVNGPIQTKFYVDIYVDLSYHLALSKVDYD